MLVFKHKSEMAKGDTLIEVLIAVTIFSLVAVGGLSVMNQGASTAQRALEITLVRQEVDAQAETLRYLNASYIAAYQPGLTASDYSVRGYNLASRWVDLREKIANNKMGVSEFGLTNSGKCPRYDDSDKDAFILNVRTQKIIDLSSDITSDSPTFSKVSYQTNDEIHNVDGIWVEGVRGGQQSNGDYIDFHIRACWDSPGQSAPVTIGTIVRLYEPL